MSRKVIHVDWMEQSADSPDKTPAPVLEKKQSKGRFTTLYESSEKKQEKPSVDVFDVGPVVYGHPEYEDRHRRFDVISNGLLDLKLSIDGHPCYICDMGDSGFSYAKKIKKTLYSSYHDSKRFVENATKHMLGKTLQASIKANGPADPDQVNLSCTIRNQRLIYGLSAVEMERELKTYLYFKKVRRNRDKHHSYEKADRVIQVVKNRLKKHSWDTGLAVSLNTTFTNLMKEVGASTSVFDRMYNRYQNKEMYIRYGASIDDPVQAKQFNEFTKRQIDRKAQSDQQIEAKSKKIENRSEAQSESSMRKKRDGYSPVWQYPEHKISFTEFLFKVWTKCLAQYTHTPGIPIPKSTNQNLANDLKQEALLYKRDVEAFQNSKDDRRPKRATERFLLEGLTKVLKPKEKEELKEMLTKIQESMKQAASE